MAPTLNTYCAAPCAHRLVAADNTSIGREACGVKAGLVRFRRAPAADLQLPLTGSVGWG